MADEQARRTYPYFPSRNWWDLRRRFQVTMPGRVDASYLQTVLDVGEGHAKNLLPQMRTIGMIDETGRTTELANQWRDDETYEEACKAIVERVYSRELTDALPPPNPDQKATERWFSRTMGVGQSMATKLAAFYRLVLSGDVTDQQTDRRAREQNADGQKRATVKRQPAQSRRKRPEPAVGRTPAEKPRQAPSLHIDVQVHIPPDATAEQIDTIFEAMAKHLYYR